MAHDVFISHVEEDADVALELALRLEQKGFSTWCYEVDSSAGVSYLDQVEKAIEQCKAIALVISRDSLGSHEVTTEVDFGHQTRKPFIPILRGIEHVEFQARQPRWRLVLGTATSVRIPGAGIDAIVPRVIDGLRKLGVARKKKPNAERLAALRKAIQEPPPEPDERLPRRSGGREPPRPPEPQPTPLQRAYEAAKRWASRPVVWLPAVLAVLVGAVVVGIVALVGVLRSGDGGAGGAVPTATTTVGTPPPVAQVPCGRSPGESGSQPGIWVTVPQIPSSAWSTGPRDGIEYGAAAVSWEDAEIEKWLSNPLQDGDSEQWVSDAAAGYKVFYPLEGGSTGAPPGAQILVEVYYEGSSPSGMPIPVWLRQGTYEVQGDGSWKGQTSFPDLVRIGQDERVGVWVSLVQRGWAAGLAGLTNSGYLAGCAIVISPSVAVDTPEPGELQGAGGLGPSARVLWVFHSALIWSSPAVVDGLVYFGSFDGYVHALDASTGEERWRFQTGGEVWSSPAVADGKVYIGSGDYSLYALNAVTGEQLWRFETGAQVNSSPTVADGVVYVGSTDGCVYAVDAATGKVLWRFQTEDWVWSSPAVIGGTVYIGSKDKYVYALDAATGELRWRFRTGGLVASSPAVVDAVVYVGSGDNSVYALDAVTGQQIWRFQTGGQVTSSPAVVAGVVYVGSEDNHVYALHAATGDEAWRFGTGKVSWSSPTVADGVVYIGSEDNSLHALDAVTGRDIWHLRTGAEMWSSPTVADGVVYVGNVNGFLYAVALH